MRGLPRGRSRRLNLRRGGVAGRHCGRVRSRGRRWPCPRSRSRAVGSRLLNQCSPGIAVTLPVPRQQAPAHYQQKQRQIEAPMASRRLVVEQIIEISGTVISQAQKRRAADGRDSGPFGFPSRGCSQQRSAAHSAEAVFGIILVPALIAPDCHGSWHDYTNLRCLSKIRLWYGLISLVGQSNTPLRGSSQLSLNLVPENWSHPEGLSVPKELARISTAARPVHVRAAQDASQAQQTIPRRGRIFKLSHHPPPFTFTPWSTACYL